MVAASWYLGNAFGAKRMTGPASWFDWLAIRMINEKDLFQLPWEEIQRSLTAGLCAEDLVGNLTFSAGEPGELR